MRTFVAEMFTESRDSIFNRIDKTTNKSSFLPISIYTSKSNCSYIISKNEFNMESVYVKRNNKTFTETKSLFTIISDNGYSMTHEIINETDEVLIELIEQGVSLYDDRGYSILTYKASDKVLLAAIEKGGKDLVLHLTPKEGKYSFTRQMNKFNNANDYFLATNTKTTLDKILISSNDKNTRELRLIKLAQPLAGNTILNYTHSLPVLKEIIKIGGKDLLLNRNHEFYKDNFFKGLIIDEYYPEIQKLMLQIGGIDILTDKRYLTNGCISSKKYCPSVLEKLLKIDGKNILAYDSEFVGNCNISGLAETILELCKDNAVLYDKVLFSILINQTLDNNDLRYLVANVDHDLIHKYTSMYNNFNKTVLFNNRSERIENFIKLDQIKKEKKEFMLKLKKETKETKNNRIQYFVMVLFMVQFLYFIFK